MAKKALRNKQEATPKFKVRGYTRCRRCGRMLRVHYVGKGAREMRYLCVNGHINQGVPKCISFGGGRVDHAISAEILKVIQPIAIDADALVARFSTELTQGVTGSPVHGSTITSKEAGSSQ